MYGITVTLYPIHQRRTYRVNIKVEPCRLLGSNDPTTLYQYSKKSFHKLQQLCDRYQEGLCIPGSIETMKISRCDLTCNLGFPDQDYVDAYLRILKKSHLISGYRVDMFKANAKKAKDPKQANQHSYCIRCKQASLLCYDKIDQMKMAGRCPHELEDEAILRLEAQLKRPALKRALGKRTLEDNAALLKAASKQSVPIIKYYLNKIFPCSGTHLRYEDAVSVVQKIKKETLREQMLYLLRKVSDAATWDSAVRKLKEHYKDVPDKRIKKIYSKFDALDIISLASCGGNNTVAMAKESKIAQDNSLITGEDEITTQNDVSKDEFERQGIIEQVKQELFAMFPMSDAQAEQANENTAVVNEYIQKNLYSMDGIENKTYEIIDRIYEDIMNVSNAANVFP